MVPVRELDEIAAERLARELRVHRVTARCLVGRGIADAAAARAYLEPKLNRLRRPEGAADGADGCGAMAGFAIAADRLTAAVLRAEPIAVFGDYDVDGVTTCALLTGFLRACGAQVHARVARRDEGYGFSPAAAADLLAHRPRLIIACDCGTSDQAQIAAARAAGVDVVVVDHHTVPASGEAHPATALVNPHRSDSAFPFRGMASVGIGFYLAAAVRTRLRAQGWFRQRSEPDPRDLLDLVAIGTIADLVPLHGENRILAAAGLARLRERKRPGLAALLTAAGLDGGDRPLDEKAVSWKLAPRLNAPGRLGDAAPALDLLLAGPDEAAARAEALETSNAARRIAQDQAVAEALASIGDADPGPALVVASDRWPAGVVGIVAAKLVDRYRRPAFVIAVDPATGIGRGSARAPGGVNLYRALGTCAPLLERWGGHAAAAGLTVRASEVDRLREALGAAVLAEGSGPVAGATADAEVRLGDVDEPLARELAELAPFGQDNPPPLLVARGAVVTVARRVGDGSHLKLEVADGAAVVRSAIGFGLGEKDPGVGATVDLVFTPVLSSWQGRTRVELEVKDVAPAAGSR